MKVGTLVRVSRLLFYHLLKLWIDEEFGKVNQTIIDVDAIYSARCAGNHVMFSYLRNGYLFTDCSPTHRKFLVQRFAKGVY